MVVPGSGPSLLGRDWLKTLLGPEWKEKLLLDWQAIHKVTAIDLSQIMDKYDHLFNKDLGTFVGVQARIHVPDGTKPCFYKARLHHRTLVLTVHRTAASYLGLCTPY